MLKGRIHPLDLGGSELEALGDRPPLGHGGGDLRRDGAGFVSTEPETGRGTKRRVERSGRVGLVESERMHAGLHVHGAGVHVEGGSQPPPLRFMQEGVVAQMVVGVRDQDVEHDPPSELLRVRLGLRALLTQHVENL